LKKYDDIKNGKKVEEEFIEAPSEAVKHQKEEQEQIEKQKEEENQAPLIDFDSDPIDMSNQQNNVQASIPPSGSNSNIIYFIDILIYSKFIFINYTIIIIIYNLYQKNNNQIHYLMTLLD